MCYLKKHELRGILHEKVKSALVKARFISINDIDAPTKYFFNLEKKVVNNNYMHCLQRPDGQITSDPLMMRRTAVL